MTETPNGKRIVESQAGFPEGSTAVGLGSGIDASISEVVRFSISEARARDLMASVVQGDFPEVDLHEFAIIDWRVWFEGEA